MKDVLTILTGDCREQLRGLPAESVQCCVTSPPYWGLRDYGHAGQIGLEREYTEYVSAMVGVFEEVRRVLKADGTLWLNLGDSYAGSWGAQSREHAGKHAPNVSALSANQVKAAQTRGSGTGSLTRAPGLKPKDLVGIPWRVAFALQAAGWYLRQDIIWHKPNPMPESVTDRCTKAHEYIFLLTKAERYYYDNEAIQESAGGWNGSRFDDGKNMVEHPTTGTNRKPRESVKRGGFNGKTNDLPGRESFRAVTEQRNKRSVWTVTTQPYRDAHFATYPPALIKPCILAGSRAGDVVLDPFGGSGTTGMVALELGRCAVLCELNPEYVALIEQRCRVTPGLRLEVA